MSESTTGASQLGSQLRHLWHTRPTRIKAQGKVAGVAAGIGYRYGVDPLLVRVAFVVSAIFGGAGIVLYLACCLVLPGDDGRLPAEDLLANGEWAAYGEKLSPTRIVLLVLLATVVLSVAPFGMDVGGAGFISAILMLGGLWLLYLRQPEPPELEPLTGPGAAAGPGSAAGPGARAGESTLPGAGALPAEAPQWWPQTYEADTGIYPPPPAWDLQKPAPAPAPEPKRHAALTPVVLGLALLSAAAAAAVAIAGGVEWLTPVRIAAVPLAVIGLGLLLGAFLRAGHGLLVIAAPLAGLVVLTSLLGPVQTRGGIGDRQHRPTSVAALQPEYRVGIGQLQVDLRGLALTADRTVDAGAGIGKVEVLVPAGMNVRVSCDVAIGETNCLPDQAAAGPLLTINAHSNIGEVVVSHG